MKTTFYPFYFFFQAEDGIRDVAVTGVQTCALPISLAEDFHADDAFTGGAHFAHDADDGIWVGIHEGANGVDPNEMDFYPERFRGSAKRFDAVARTTVSADDALFFGFGENIHDAFVALGPIAFAEAVHKADVDVIGAEFAAEAVEIRTSGDGVARPGLG